MSTNEISNSMEPDSAESKKRGKEEEKDLEHPENKKLRQQLLELQEENLKLQEELRQQRLERQEEQEENSVKALLESMPRMTVSEPNKPSIIENNEARRKVTAYRAGYSQYEKQLATWQSASNKTVGLGKKLLAKLTGMKQKKEKPEPPVRPKFHYPAEIVTRQLPSDLLNIQVNLIDGAGKLIKSQLHMEADNTLMFTTDHRRLLSHDNETSPQDYLALVMKDVIKCCGFRGRFKVVKEATLFSLRPDLLVFILEGRLLLVAEVKNPGKLKKPATGEAETHVFNSETAGGQTWDYLKALKQQGIDWPFALLSTYNQTVIAWLPDDEQTYNEILRAGLQNAEDCPSDRHKGNSKIETEDKPLNSSSYKPGYRKRLASIGAPPAAASMTEEKEEDAEEDDEDMASGFGNNTAIAGHYDYEGRKIVYSQVFDVDMLFKAMVLALESSYESFNKSKQHSAPLLPEEGTPLDKELCTLYHKGFAYEKTSIKAVTYCKPPKIPLMKKYHVLCQVGQGRSGKTILCSSSSGKLFAVKLFLIKASLKYSEEERKEEEDKRLEENYETAKIECSRWKKLEPRYKDYCHVVTLNGLPAITMPYFPPVPPEERINALPLIEERLGAVAKEKLYYNQCDLRWRHFGCRWTESNMDITLLDLGSLDVEEKDLKKQVQELWNRRNVDEPEEVKPVVV